MKRYIIKGTYLEGCHTGREFYMIKGGYVTNNPDTVMVDDTYTEKACKSYCTRLTNDNEVSRRIELSDREKRIRDGKSVSKYPIYTLTKFEPMLVSVSDMRFQVCGDNGVLTVNSIRELKEIVGCDYYNDVLEWVSNCSVGDYFNHEKFEIIAIE